MEAGNIHKWKPLQNRREGGWRRERRCRPAQWPLTDALEVTQGSKKAKAGIPARLT
jgi:hypothetical protein